MNMKEFMLTIINFFQTMMNFMIISRKVTIEGPVRLYAGPFGLVWGTTRNRIDATNAIHSVNYLYNNKVYTYVSRSLKPMWPPVSPPREMGFRPAIKSADVVIKGNLDRKCDVTRDIKRMAGPRGDWHQRRFSPRDVFGSSCSNVIMTDVLGGVRTVDADETFYISSNSTSEAK